MNDHLEHDCEIEWPTDPFGEQWRSCQRGAVGRFYEPHSGETMWLCEEHRKAHDAYVSGEDEVS